VAGSSRTEKNWFPQGYARVLEEVTNRFGMQPVLVGGRTAAEDTMAGEIVSSSPVPVHDARANDLRRLLWLLEGSSLVISPDSGPLHMARAMEVPVVGLYGATNPKRSGPFGMFSELVVDGYARYPGEVYACSPARRKGGMARVTPEMVLEKIDLAVERYCVTRPHPPDPPPPHPPA
jgi:heptosyltransferase I